MAENGNSGGGYILGCFAWLNSGAFGVSGSGQASYDTLRASAGIGFSAVDPSPFIGTNSLLGRALASAHYDDTLVIDIPGRTGEVVDLVFETALNGNMSASADFTHVYAQAEASLWVNVNGARVTVSRAAKSSGDPIFNDFNPGRVQIELGSPFAVTGDLDVEAYLQRTTGSTQFFSGDAVSNFSNSGRITSFSLFESGAGGALIPEWNLSSASGQFGFYSVVTIPAAAWLFGSALGLLGWMKRQYG